MRVENWRALFPRVNTLNEGRGKMSQQNASVSACLLCHLLCLQKTMPTELKPEPELNFGRAETQFALALSQGEIKVL